MATAAVVGLTSGKKMLRTSFYSSDLNEKLFSIPADHSPKSVVVVSAKKPSNFGPNYQSKRDIQAIRALKEHAHVSSFPSPKSNLMEEKEEEEEEEEEEENSPDVESSLETLILLQKAMLEKQWNLSFDNEALQMETPSKIQKKKTADITRSGVSARERRSNNTRRRCLNPEYPGVHHLPLSSIRQNIVTRELLQTRLKGYVRGTTSRKDILSHSQVIHLSKKIKVGLSLEDRRKRLKEKLGYEPSDKELASSLRMSYAQVRLKLIACSLAREKLAMSNFRLVMSIAQKYDNLGAELPDLVQGGLIGLVRGIEKFDSSKGFRISTYVYWWIRQGVSRVLVENSRTLRLPSHLHERLCSIRNAKIRLEKKGVMPSVAKIAEALNISERMVRNATDAVSRVFSLDRDAFPSLNGLPGETLHSYIADTHPENNPWRTYEELSKKDEVNKLLITELCEREREIIRLYYGIESDTSCTWEDISRQIGLSRERVRQVGLVALEKLKHAARRRKLEAMLVKH